jgi:hypothetical protein
MSRPRLTANLAEDRLLARIDAWRKERPKPAPRPPMPDHVRLNGRLYVLSTKPKAEAEALFQSRGGEE